jgi:hypothetical protein
MGTELGSYLPDICVTSVEDDARYLVHLLSRSAVISTTFLKRICPE